MPLLQTGYCPVCMNKRVTIKFDRSFIGFMAESCHAGQEMRVTFRIRQAAGAVSGASLMTTSCHEKTEHGDTGDTGAA
jgi:hypothetical protein